MAIHTREKYDNEGAEVKRDSNLNQLQLKYHTFASFRKTHDPIARNESGP